MNGRAGEQAYRYGGGWGVVVEVRYTRQCSVQNQMNVLTRERFYQGSDFGIRGSAGGGT